MVTRGTFSIITNTQKFRVYNHYDSYTSSLGRSLLEKLSELIKKYGVETLENKFEKVKLITEDDVYSNDIDIYII